MGVNALIVEMNGEKASMQVGDIVKRKSPDDMPQGTVWGGKPIPSSNCHLSGSGDETAGS